MDLGFHNINMRVTYQDQTPPPVNLYESSWIIWKETWIET